MNDVFLTAGNEKRGAALKLVCGHESVSSSQRLEQVGGNISHLRVGIGEVVARTSAGGRDLFRRTPTEEREDRGAIGLRRILQNEESGLDSGRSNLFKCDKVVNHRVDFPCVNYAVRQNWNCGQRVRAKDREGCHRSGCSPIVCEDKICATIIAPGLYHHPVDGVCHRSSKRESRSFVVNPINDRWEGVCAHRTKSIRCGVLDFEVLFRILAFFCVNRKPLGETFPAVAWFRGLRDTGDDHRRRNNYRDPCNDFPAGFHILSLRRTI